MTKNELIASVKARNSRTGIVTADRYFREVEGCFDGGFCPVKHVGAESGDQWSKALKEAESKLTFQDRQMRVLSKSLKRSRSDEFIAEFDAVITTTRRDRDGDVLETKGAELDNDGPLLLHHMSMMPIGRGIKVIHHSHKVLKEKLGIADNDLGRDTLPLVKARVLRISHGFDPKEWEPMDDDNGWRFTKFVIFERSLVSVPSNIDAVVTDFAEKDFKTDIMRGWYDGMRKSIGRRKTSVVTVPADVEDGQEALHEAIKEDALSESEILSAASTITIGDKTWKAEAWVLDTTEPSSLTKTETTEQPGDATGTADEQTPDTGPPDAPSEKSLADIEREYIAELAVCEDTDVLRKAHRRIGLMLRHAEDQEEAKELDELLSTFN